MPPLVPSSVEPLVVGPREAKRLLSVGTTRFYEILPELESYLDGGSRKITVRSIYQRIANKLAAPAAKRLMPPRHRSRTSRKSHHSAPTA
jgi:hypothetical protein